MNVLKCLVSLCLFVSSTLFAQESDSPWRQLSAKTSLASGEILKVNVEAGQRLALDLPSIQALLRAPSGEALLDLPLPDGSFARFQLQVDSVMAEDLARQYPSIQTFVGQDLNNPLNQGRFDLTPQGFHGVFNYEGREIYIDPEVHGDSERYVSFYGKEAQPLSPILPDRYYTVERVSNELRAAAAKKLTGDTLKTYRLAVSAVGEYTEFHGGTVEQGLAAITTVVNRVNDIFIRDLAVRFELVANTDQVIYTDAATDPFANNDDDVDTNEAVQAENIGTANFDIGHVFNTGGGGLAYDGVCDSRFKARGMSGSSQPVGSFFYVDLVAHEIGHQLGASHTFNGTAEACSGNRVASTAWEPGSGSSIMAYSGICGEQNLQVRADAFFHSGSIAQIRDYITTGFGSGCGVESAIANTAPTADAGSDYSVPANTPLIVSGVGGDADGDALTYTWDQIDVGASTATAAEMVDDGTRTLFRFVQPTDSEARYLPRLRDIVDGSLSVGETLPATNRLLNLRFTVRDGLGGLTFDDLAISVRTDSGPFSVTSPSGGENWVGGSSETISWDVANTDQSPVSCAQVDILMSPDNNIEFDTTLLSNTANDGSQTVTVPNVNSDSARLMVRCSNQRFYALNAATISVSSSTPNTPPQAGDDALSVDENSGQIVVDVLSNDSDSDSGDSISLLSIDYTGNSSVSQSGDQILYQPASNFSGTDTITYTIVDESGAQASALLTVTVRAATVTGGGSGSSGGGGGGGSFSLWGLALLLMMVVLSGCQNPSSNPDERAAEENLEAGTNDASSEALMQDLNAALEQKDYRLLMMSGRRPTMPGVGAEDVERLMALCGKRYLSGTGDHLSNEAQAVARKLQREYAIQYNQKMSEHCQSQSQ